MTVHRARVGLLPSSCASLGLLAFALLCAPTAWGQDEEVVGTVILETTAGFLFVDLEEDDPTVRPYARAFASLVADRVFFHESDKRIGCDAEDENCFLCDCQFLPMPGTNCLGEPVGLCTDGADQEHVCTNPTPEYRVDQEGDPEPDAEPDDPPPTDPVITARVLRAGLLELDAQNQLQEKNASLAPLPPNPQAVFANNAFTVAFVRDDQGNITPEWVINLEDNSELAYGDGSYTFDGRDTSSGAIDLGRAYFVIGQLSSGQNVATGIAELKTTDARCNCSLGPPDPNDECPDPPPDDTTPASILMQLEQLPIIDTFEDEDGNPDPDPQLLEICDADDDACLNPDCLEVSNDLLRCEEPVCYAVTEIPPEEQVDGIAFRCDFPVDPNFPLVAFANPLGITLVNNGLAPPEATNVLDFPNNPGLTIDVRDRGCTLSTEDPPGNCTTGLEPTLFEVSADGFDGTTGSASLVRVSDRSRLTLSVGQIETLELRDTARASLEGGQLEVANAMDGSELRLSGGTVDHWTADADSSGRIDGGGVNTLDALAQSFVRIVSSAGGGFTVDGTGVPFGPVVDDTGLLAGMLLGGTMLNVDFDRGGDAGTLYLLDGAELQAVVSLILVDTPNAADPDTGLGAVSADYWITQSEISNGEYAGFLNAMGRVDPFGLWDSRMNDIGIERTGGQGNFRYEAVTGRADKPVVYVSLFDAMRYANWLHNGSPLQGDENAEDGSYLFEDGVLVGGRQPGATWVVPTADEWFKAAYYDASSDAWLEFPTASDTEPSAQLPSRDVGNGVNAEAALPADSPRSEAGAYAFSASPYGTFDQGGNVLEWLEDSLDLRGGHWNATAAATGRQATPITVADSDSAEDFVGFRLVSLVPEPSAALLAGSALLALAGIRRGGKALRREV